LCFFTDFYASLKKIILLVSVFFFTTLVLFNPDTSYTPSEKSATFAPANSRREGEGFKVSGCKRQFPPKLPI